MEDHASTVSDEVVLTTRLYLQSRTHTSQLDRAHDDAVLTTRLYA